MAQLKQIFDQAKSASDDLAALKNEIETLYNSGSEEDLAKAVTLSDSLDAATKKANDLNKLYLSMRDADNTATSAASLFVSDPESPEEEAAESVKPITRGEFKALTAVEREKAVKSGVKIVE
jgi:hypothetical protein